jgi:hypothetical protein
MKTLRTKCAQAEEINKKRFNKRIAFACQVPSAKYGENSPSDKIAPTTENNLVKDQQRVSRLQRISA